MIYPWMWCGWTLSTRTAKSKTEEGEGEGEGLRERFMAMMLVWYVAWVETDTGSASGT